MMSLSDKTVFITGGAKRIGRAIALDLADAGMDVVIHYHRSEEAAAQLVSEISAMGRRAFAVRGDLADTAHTTELFREAVLAAGPIDALVNSASIFNRSTLLDFSFDGLFHEVAVNAFSPLVLARAFAAQKRGGVIVNLLDSRINAYDALHAAYHLSKRMLHSMTRMLALELAPAIRVNAVAPGLILPPPGEEMGYLDAHKNENPLGRSGSVEGVAEAIRYLVAAEFVSGQVIFVDGGRHLKSSVYG